MEDASELTAGEVAGPPNKMRVREQLSGVDADGVFYSGSRAVESLGESSEEQMSVDDIGLRVWVILINESSDEANGLSLWVSIAENFTRRDALATSRECRSEQRGQIIGSMR